jgi:hypothetical protein
MYILTSYGSMELCSLQLFYLTTFYCFKKGLLILQRHSASRQHKAPVITNAYVARQYYAFVLAGDIITASIVPHHYTGG